MGVAGGLVCGGIGAYRALRFAKTKGEAQFKTAVKNRNFLEKSNPEKNEKVRN